MPDSDTQAQGVTTLLQRHALLTRRKELRYPCGPATAGRLNINKGNAAQRAWVLNLSASGIGLLLDRAMEPKTHLVIHVKSTRTGAFFDLVALVVHCTPQNNGEWLVGCKLAEELRQDDLDALL